MKININLPFIKSKNIFNLTKYIEVQYNTLSSVLPEIMIKNNTYNIDEAIAKFIEIDYLRELMNKSHEDYEKIQNSKKGISRYIEFSSNHSIEDISSNFQEKVYREIQRLGGRPYLIKASEINPHSTEKSTSVENVTNKNSLDGNAGNFAAIIVKYCTKFEKDQEIFFPSDRKSSNLKDILSIYSNLDQIVDPTKKFTIKVEGEDKQSEEIATNLYYSFIDGRYLNAARDILFGGKNEK
jgi:hypothetical protein